ncbi:MAG TPA: hypothetical protein VK502_02230 [Candidatus Saccharimonadales bacterium]|nr:hypothetical protein [Candidatus Saccharimonadales bacterium]
MLVIGRLRITASASSVLSGGNPVEFLEPRSKCANTLVAQLPANADDAALSSQKILGFLEPQIRQELSRRHASHPREYTEEVGLTVHRDTGQLTYCPLMFEFSLHCCDGLRDNACVVRRHIRIVGRHDVPFWAIILKQTRHGCAHRI